MAKYTVHHSCGHEEIHQLYGPGKERQRKIAWLATTPCTECYRGAQAEARTAANAQAATANAQAGLPALTGSEKQIAWAEAIRRTALIGADEVRAKAEAFAAAHPDRATETAPALALIARAEAETSAAWWIDHRTAECATDLIRRMHTEITS